MTDEPTTFGFSHRVRYHETDAQQHVFNSRYLEWADVGFTEYLRSLGWPYPELIERGFDPVVVRSEIQFHAPARLDDLLDITVRCVRLGRSSFDLSIRVSRDGEPVASIENAYVNYSAAERSSRPVPEDIAGELARHVGR